MTVKETCTNKRMLVIRFSALGDVAMTLPVVYSLAKQYPNLRITMLTTPFFARLFINKPENIEVMVVDLKSAYHGSKGLFRLIAFLSKKHFDYVADLHNVLRSWIIGNMFRMKGCRVKMVNKGRKERIKLLHANKSITTRSYILRYQDTFERLGFPVTLSFHSLFDGIEVFSPFSIAEKSVGIAPFARYTNKTYPLENICKLVRILSKKGFSVYLFGGGKHEQEILEQIEKENQNVYSLAGKYAIEDELRIISKMKVMVSMDSANHHLASLVGTPVVSIWGSTTPACGFMAYGQDIGNALCQNLDCQPCCIAGSEKCINTEKMKCMYKLSPEHIASRIDAIIKSKQQ